MAVDASGVPTKAAALQAAALAFGPIPGVQTPSGAAGGSFSSSGPYRWISARWGELDDAARAAIRANLAKLFPPGGPPVPTWSTSSHRLAAVTTVPAVPFADSPGVAHIRSLVDDAISRISARLGRQLTMRTAIWRSSSPEPGGAYAAASHWQVDGSAYPGCWITVFPKAFNTSDADLLFLLTHEVFHCFQDDVLSFAQVSDLPAWVIEGQAAWVGLDAGGPTELMTDASRPGNMMHWRGWLQHPERSLLARAYDAVGFYTVLNDTGVDVWKVLDPMLTAGAGGAYAAAVAGAPNLLEERWASSDFRSDTPSRLWDIHTGVGPTPKAVAPPPVVRKTVANDASADVPSAEPFSATLVQLDVTADVVVLSSDGVTRVGDSATIDTAPRPGTELDLCTKSGGCACPDGSPGRAPTRDAVPPLLYGIGGGPTPSHPNVTGVSLQEWCKAKPTSSSAPGQSASACDLLPPSEVTAAIGVDIGSDTGAHTALDSCIRKNGEQVWAVQAHLLATPLPSLPATGPADCASFGGTYRPQSGYFMCTYDQGPAAGKGLVVRSRYGIVIVTTTDTLTVDEAVTVAAIIARHLGT